MHPVPQLFDPQTLVVVLASTLGVLVAIVVGALAAESDLARLRARRRARSGRTAVESA